MSSRVFSQEPDLMAALPRLLAHARRFFAAELTVLEGSPIERPDLAKAQLRLRFEGKRLNGSGTFRVISRESTSDDRFLAEAAEARGNAGGMALLAARCPVVWEVSPETDVAGSAELQLAALLASVALGPVLPADGSTLYGVRGAMERAEKVGG
jgi:hypothetical protein